MKISLVGIGLGNPDLLTEAARAELCRCEAIIGARRIIDALPRELCPNRIEAVEASKIARCVFEHPEWTRIAVALSGDVGFYSGAKKLSGLLTGHELEAFCGISSVQYLCSRLLRPWQGMHLVSAHGMRCDILAQVLNNSETFFLTDGVFTPRKIAELLCDAGLENATVTVGERLSYPDEKISSGTAREMTCRDYDKLNAVIVDSESGFKYDFATAGLSDDEFVRGEVPMTKQEIRAAAMAKLRLRSTDTVYDIGAGTGSVSVEMALVCRMGRVYAIECNGDACELIERNKESFEVFNLNVIKGSAPEALLDLPAPDAVFIGGTKGSMRENLELVLNKNGAVRVVISAISLETLSSALSAVKELEMRDIEVVQIASSRTRAVGGHHMLMAQNPIFLISANGKGAE
ncbi:MAG: precorrin-6y C5,15-methyltransferase (decarboxylating) subunit CbiE [Oscillospiraceae bacterium]